MSNTHVRGNRPRPARASALRRPEPRSARWRRARQPARAGAFALRNSAKTLRVWNEDGMLEKYSFLPRARIADANRPANRRDVDVAIALDTAIQNRLGTTLAAVASAQNLDQHRSSPEQSRLWRPGLHRSNRAGHRTDSFRTDQEPGLADRPRHRGKSFRRDLDRHRLVSISEHDRAHV